MKRTKVHVYLTQKLPEVQLPIIAFIDMGKNHENCLPFATVSFFQFFLVTLNLFDCYSRQTKNLVWQKWWSGGVGIKNEGWWITNDIFLVCCLSYKFKEAVVALGAYLAQCFMESEGLAQVLNTVELHQSDFKGLSKNMPYSDASLLPIKK